MSQSGRILEEPLELEFGSDVFGEKTPEGVMGDPAIITPPPPKRQALDDDSPLAVPLVYDDEEPEKPMASAQDETLLHEDDYDTKSGSMDAGSNLPANDTTINADSTNTVSMDEEVDNRTSAYVERQPISSAPIQDEVKEETGEKSVPEADVVPCKLDEIKMSPTQTEEQLVSTEHEIEPEEFQSVEPENDATELQESEAVQTRTEDRPVLPDSLPDKQDDQAEEGVREKPLVVAGRNDAREPETDQTIEAASNQDEVEVNEKASTNTQENSLVVESTSYDQERSAIDDTESSCTLIASDDSAMERDNIQVELNEKTSNLEVESTSYDQERSAINDTESSCTLVASDDSANNTQADRLLNEKTSNLEVESTSYDQERSAIDDTESSCTLVASDECLVERDNTQVDSVAVEDVGLEAASEPKDTELVMQETETITVESPQADENEEISLENTGSTDETSEPTTMMISTGPEMGEDEAEDQVFEDNVEPPKRTSDNDSPTDVTEKKNELQDFAGTNSDKYTANAEEQEEEEEELVGSEAISEPLLSRRIVPTSHSRDSAHQPQNETNNSLAPTGPESLGLLERLQRRLREWGTRNNRLLIIGLGFLTVASIVVLGFSFYYNGTSTTPADEPVLQ